MPRGHFAYGTETETTWRYQRIMSNDAFINHVDGSRKHFMQLFLLDLLHVNLSLSSLLTRQLLEESPDISRADTFKIVDAATTHSVRVQIFEEMILVAEDMLTVFSYISRRAINVEIVEEKPSPAGRSLRQKLDDLHLELKEHKTTAHRLLDLSNKKYSLTKDLRDVNQAYRAYWLTALAAVFLPMSLACSLLSMQVRITQLHALLYDFFGLVLIMGTVVVVIGPAIRFILNFGSWWDQRNMSSKVSYGKSFLHQRLRESTLTSTLYNMPGGKQVVEIARSWKGRAILAARSALYIFWCNMLASFFVGFQNLELGLKILGYGTAALSCLAIALVVLYPLLFHGRFLFKIISATRDSIISKSTGILKRANVQVNDAGGKEDGMARRVRQVEDRLREGPQRVRLRSRSRRRTKKPRRLVDFVT
jgi:hypothetical protein